MPVAWLGRGVREIFRRELIPARLRWWFVAEGMCDWYLLLRRELAPHLGGEAAASAVLARLSVSVFHRRYDRLPVALGIALPDRARAPSAVGLLMGGLYRLASAPKARFIFDDVGGGPRSFAEHRRAEELMTPMTMAQRWDELTHHLGELLIALTEGLPPHMSRARGILGDLCFAAGVRFSKKMRKAFDLETTPEGALEVLRMSEYIFQVNPEHWGESSAERGTGYLEGTACPWFTAPGWNGAHCGIFGQFQAGISSVFGLRYHLTTTIPKHGGHTCRIDLKPLPLGRKRALDVGTTSRAPRTSSEGS